MRYYVKRRNISNPKDSAGLIFSLFNEYYRASESHCYLVTLPQFQKHFSRLKAISGVRYIDSASFPEMYFPLTNLPTTYGLFDVSNIQNSEDFINAFHSGVNGRGWVIVTLNPHFPNSIFKTIEDRFVKGGDDLSFYQNILHNGGILIYSIVVGDEIYNEAAEEFVFNDEKIWQQADLFNWADILYSIEPGTINLHLS